MSVNINPRSPHRQQWHDSLIRAINDHIRVWHDDTNNKYYAISSSNNRPPYELSVIIMPDPLNYKTITCSCPGFRNHSYCKHVVKLAITLDKEGEEIWLM